MRSVDEFVDGAEYIAKCLNCKKTYCDNCIEHIPKHDGWRCKPVAAYRKDGTLAGSYFSSKQAQFETGVSRQSIDKSLKGVNKTAGGYVWRYV